MMSFVVKTIDAQGAFLFGGSIALAGIIGGVLALVMSQIMATSTAATCPPSRLIWPLHCVRAGTPECHLALSMFNAMGWIYLTYPFTSNNLLPLLFALIFSLVFTVLAFVLEEHRDMGAGYRPEREGRATAKKSLLSVPGLFFKINKGVMIGWLIAFVVMGRSEEHTSELQSRFDLVCRLLLE